MLFPPQIQTLTFHLFSSFRDNYHMTTAAKNARGRFWGTAHSASIRLRIL